MNPHWKIFEQQKKSLESLNKRIEIQKELGWNPSLDETNAKELENRIRKTILDATQYDIDNDCQYSPHSSI